MCVVLRGWFFFNKILLENTMTTFCISFSSICSVNATSYSKINHVCSVVLYSHVLKAQKNKFGYFFFHWTAYDIFQLSSFWMRLWKFRAVHLHTWRWRKNKSGGGSTDAHHHIHLLLWRMPPLCVVPFAPKAFTMNLRAHTEAPVETWALFNVISKISSPAIATEHHERKGAWNDVSVLLLISAVPNRLE